MSWRPAAVFGCQPHGSVTSAVPRIRRVEITTPVNWERLNGDLVEEFVAALVISRVPDANRITASRGDRGIDIVAPSSDGLDVYQVKRYTRPLQARELREIEQSWRQFVEQVLAVERVRSWNLITPWDPTPERWDWFRALTGDAGIIATWHGRTNLDTWAAAEPQLIDYYFGDGNRRTHELMQQALNGGAQLAPGLEGEPLLDGIIQRHLALAEALNNVDWFYRYEIAVRQGDIDTIEQSVVREADDGAVWIKYEQVSADRYLVLRLYPRRGPSTMILRPLVVGIGLQPQVGTSEQAALERFLLYGAAFDELPGVVTAVEGPPGAMMPTGPGIFSVRSVAGDTANLSRPDLDLRLLTESGEQIHAVPLADVQQTRGVIGAGTRLTATDTSGALIIELLLNVPDRPEGIQLNIDGSRLIGRTPREVLPALELLAGLRPGQLITLGVLDGPQLGRSWQISDDVAALAGLSENVAQMCRQLAVIQQRTQTRIAIPERTPNPADLSRAVRLIRGQHVDWQWPHIDLTTTNFEHFATWTSGDEFEVMVDEWLFVELDETRIQTDVKIRRWFGSARFADGDPSTGSVRLIPGSQANGRDLVVDDPSDWVHRRVRSRQIGVDIPHGHPNKRKIIG